MCQSSMCCHFSMLCFHSACMSVCPWRDRLTFLSVTCEGQVSAYCNICKFTSRETLSLLKFFIVCMSQKVVDCPVCYLQHLLRQKAGILPSLEDLLFYTIAEGQEKIPAHKFTTALKATGLRTGDPRLKECMEMLKITLKTTSDGALDRHLFKKCVQSNIVLLTQAFRKKFVIPDFQSFTSHVDQIYESAKSLSGGQVADYIPQLAKFSPNLWAVALCTVDGQRYTAGDTKVPFCLQSCVKPLKYAVAVHDHGTEYVHRFIGKEPSGLRFNKLFLDEDDKPHNPMVNAGAIVCTSLLKQGVSNAEKFDYVMNFMKKLAGNEYVGFSNATFQSERLSGDRNFAIGYYLKEKKCFPEGTDMISILDLYFQLCSIEVTCESASVMAATLANGGFCPITGERVLNPEAVRNTLSLMHSCGMYDFSGQFAFHVGLPAKSGVSGGILLVVPNVMGIMCWSPPLDKLGNSVRGIQFCTDLVHLCNFHNYDNLRHFAKKLDPRREGGDQRQQQQQNLEPLDYTSLQKELALTDKVWKKVCPSETDEDSSTTVVYRMENVAERN
ncbi:glutaminase a isoform X4 [Onychostoma macrolepis]|uniref:glutaminase a isoform X4 n=1 Tax=Onychostoma macrolepis TaxID=369639 RepID=UPI002729F089|nr:glutaminase a isoform X4 [Onychostoma macrolepis]